MLNLFESTLRFLSSVALLNYFYYSDNNVKVNNLVCDDLFKPEAYPWKSVLFEIISTESDKADDFFMPELMRLCQKNIDHWAEFSAIVEEFLPLLSPNEVNAELDVGKFPMLLERFSAKISHFLAQVSFLKDYSLVRYSGQTDKQDVYKLEMFQGLSQQSLTQKIRDSSDLNIEHLFLYDQNRKKLLDLFPFITTRRCEHCLGEHFFFYNGLREFKTTLYYDLELNHSINVQKEDIPLEFGSLFLKKNLFQQAQELFVASLELNPHSVLAKSKILFCHEKIGNYYYQKENYYRALKDYEEALRLDPENARVLFNLGLVYKKIKENSQAIEILNRLVKKHPNYYRAFEVLGYLYEDTGNYTKALFYYNRFLKHDPDNQGVSERRAVIMKKITENAKAEKNQPKPSQSDDKTLSFEEMVSDLNKEVLDRNPKRIIGRDQEIDEICQVLGCMKKNNALIIGEAGVGKTALVEELARRIVQGEVPSNLRQKRILQLKAATLLAGTKYRGQFEERMLLLINEVKKRTNCILFIDDMHTIMHAGMTKGSSVDVANVLKPELARGDIQMIGICTYDEFRLYLEKDPAFERRFQIVKINEPDTDVCLEIMTSVKGNFERFHGVIVDHDTLQVLIELPRIYLRDRHLPDKAIDLLDRACSMVAIEHDQKNDGTDISLPQVTATDVIRAVSQLTRIPIAKIALSHSRRFVSMEEVMKTKVIGQEEAISIVSEVIRTTKMEFDINPMRPDGVFLFVGPTGVGKTELARVMAEFLFGDEDKMLRIDMSEFTDDISTSKLIGITPGYVGYNDRNQLTDHVRNYPYSLILLDEVEKANRQVLNLFLQVFDCGRLTDGRGRTVYFNNATFVMTSNIGADLFSKSKVGYGQTAQNGDDVAFHRNVSKGELKKAVELTFPPEFINRIDEIVYFRTLSKTDVRKIAELQLETIRKKLEREGKTLILTDNALDFIVEKGYSEQFGARNLARIIRRFLLDPLALRSLQPEWQDTVSIEVCAVDEELRFS